MTERLCAKMGWPTAMLHDRDFPLKQLRIDYVFETMSFSVSYHKDETFGYLYDPRAEFPSDELRAALLFLTGPLDELIVRHRPVPRRPRR